MSQLPKTMVRPRSLYETMIHSGVHAAGCINASHMHARSHILHISTHHSTTVQQTYIATAAIGLTATALVNMAEKMHILL